MYNRGQHSKTARGKSKPMHGIGIARFPLFSIHTLICFLVSIWLYVEVGCHTNIMSNLRMRAPTVSAISLHTAYGTPPCPGAVSGNPTIMP